MRARLLSLAFAASFAGLSLPTAAQTVPAPSAEARFHRAYFLEHERAQLAEALALYEEVAGAKEAGATLQAEARERAADVREDLASQDLAALMPAGALAYLELVRPGEAVTRLLGQLGLSGSFEQAAAQGGLTLRPELIQSLVGIRGLAVALTRLPVAGGSPGGVLVLNAGDVELVRGLVETGVLAGGTPEEPIEGTRAWTLPSGLHVAVGRRLVIASDAREEIAGVLRRLRGPDEPSLLGDVALRDQLESRGGTPFFAFLNAVPLRPMLQGLLSGSRGDPGLALLGTALDVGSLRGVVARLAVAEDGLTLETELALEQDHRNLVFNLLRGAPLDPALLACVPEGSAAFLAGAFSERGPALAPLHENAAGAPVVTAMDFGRELFANLAGFTLFVAPGGAPLPKAALVLSSNDPARTGAVLGLLLGLGNALTSGQPLEGESDEIAGAPTRVFRLPPGVPLYLTTHENTLILSPSEELIEEAIEGRGRGRSVLHDEAFASEIGRLGKDTTFALCAHVGRTLAVVEPFLGGEPRASLARFAPLLARTVLALRSHHSDARLGLGLTVHGLPHVDGLVGDALRRQRASLGQHRAKPEAGLLERFSALAAGPEGSERAVAFAQAQLPLVGDDARALNNFAWALLTEERFQGRFDDLAADYAEAACAASDQGVWQYLDTLALARFRAGATREAIELEQRALGLVEASAERAEVEAALARFQAALGAVAEGARPR